MKVKINGFDIEGNLDEIKELIGIVPIKVIRQTTSERRNKVYLKQGRKVSLDEASDAQAKLTVMVQKYGVGRTARKTGINHGSLYNRSVHPEKFKNQMTKNMYNAIINGWNEFQSLYKQNP